MCDPATAMFVVAATAAATTYIQYEDQKDAAKKQTRMLEDSLEKDRANTSVQYEQIQESAKDDQAQLHTQMLIDKARLRAINAESGLAGATQDRTALELENNASADMATLEQNRERKVVNAASQSQARGTQASIQLSGIRKPSSLGAGLQIVGYGAQGYASYKNASAKAPSTPQSASATG